MLLLLYVLPGPIVPYFCELFSCLRVFYQLTVCIYRFTSGKLVITGSKSSSEALLSAFHVCRLLRRVCVGQKFQVVAYDIQNIVMCYSVIYEFLSANSVYLQVGNAELDVKEGQILDIEGAPKPWLLGSGLVLSNCSPFQAFTIATTSILHTSVIFL